MEFNIKTKKLIFYVTVSIIYALFYYKYRTEFNGLNDKSTYLDCFYFSFTTFSTVGYGDISPSTKFAKILVMSQQILLLLDFVDEFSDFLDGFAN